MNRAERLWRRTVVIAKRLRIIRAIWLRRDESNQAEIAEPGRLAKFNLNCGSPMCHYRKYFSYKRQRRESLKRAEDVTDYKEPK